LGKGACNCGQDKNRREQKVFFHSFIIVARRNDFKIKNAKKGGLPVASGIAKPLDIVAPIAKARELRYSV